MANTLLDVQQQEEVRTEIQKQISWLKDEDFNFGPTHYLYFRISPIIDERIHIEWQKEHIAIHVELTKDSLSDFARNVFSEHFKDNEQVLSSTWWRRIKDSVFSIKDSKIGLEDSKKAVAMMVELYTNVKPAIKLIEEEINFRHEIETRIGTFAPYAKFCWGSNWFYFTAHEKLSSNIHYEHWLGDKKVQIHVEGKTPENYKLLNILSKKLPQNSHSSTEKWSRNPGRYVVHKEIDIKDVDTLIKEFRALYEMANPIIEKFLSESFMKHQKYITLLEEHCNLILTGAPGTGKTYLAKEIAKEMILQQEDGADELQDDELEELMRERTGFVQFHPSYDYTDFVEGLRPIEKGDTLGFKRKDGIFKEFCKRALTAAKRANEEGREAPKYIFIIDEINRGELSKIFGELFFCIDPGYRGVKGRMSTQYQNLIKEDDDFFDGFYIPENVYILGTMNDIDRSVESMDFAMRRRFAWKEIKAMDRVEMLNELNEYKDEAIARMENLNEEISRIEGLGGAFHIGPAYFRKLKNGDFHLLWEMNLEPLLKEYLRGMRDADEKMRGLEDAYNKNRNSDVEAEDISLDTEQ